MSYNNTFQDRAGQAAEAKQKALDQFRARPQVDEKVAAERLAAGQQRAEAKARKASDRKAEKQATAKASVAADAANAASAAPKTEAELKAARDERYAMRKARK